MKNIFLKLIFRYFRQFAKRLNLENRQLVFEDNFETLDNFNVKANDFYNDNPIWLSKGALSLTSQGLKITCKKEVATHTSYQGTRETKWITGMIDSYGKFEFSGLWLITAKLNDGWPALWLLKKGRLISGYKRGQITPEIDIVETIQGKFRHTIHYGYSDVVYRRTSTGTSVVKADDKFHEFGVDILKNGYDFYIDGILTGEFRSEDPEFVTDDKSYLVINNAAHPYSTEDTEMIIKSIKVYS